MKKSFSINFNSNMTRQTLAEINHFLDEVSKIDGVEIDRNEFKIIYDSSIEGEVGKLLDKHILK